MYPRSTARIVPGANRSVRATLISLVLPSVTTANHGRYPSWSSSRCSLMAPLVRRNFAQSNMLTDRSMTLPSRLISLFLKRNFCRPPWLCTSSWHLHSVCSNTVWYNSHGRCSLAVGVVPDGVRADAVQMPGTGAKPRRAAEVPFQKQADEPGRERHRPVGEHVRLGKIPADQGRH